MKLEKRHSHGLNFTSFYTWGKAIDEASSDGAAAGITFYNRRFKQPFFNPPNSVVNFRNPQQFGKITSAQGGFGSLGGALYWHMIFKLEF